MLSADRHAELEQSDYCVDLAVVENATYVAKYLSVGLAHQHLENDLDAYESAAPFAFAPCSSSLPVTVGAAATVVLVGSAAASIVHLAPVGHQFVRVMTESLHATIYCGEIVASAAGSFSVQGLVIVGVG